MAEHSIEKKIDELLRDTVTSMGYELYDIEYLKEGKEFHLCIYIDRPDGIDLNDCEKVTDVINPILDEADYIKEQYFLEVSSTGLEKKLRKMEHFERQIGNEIEVNLYSKIDGKKRFNGILKECRNKILVLDIGKGDIEIDFDQISSAKTVFDW